MTPPIVASYWTLSGRFPGREPEYSRFDFEVRCKAAAHAGFSGLGIWHADLEHILETRSLPDMKRILDDNGLCHVEVEFLTDWFVTGERKRKSDLRKQQLFDAAEVLGAELVKIGDFHREHCPMPELIDAFAELCREAAERGTRVGFEFMSAAMIDNLADALTMVEGAGEANGGIVLDLWHVVNGRIPYDRIALIPSRHLFRVEVNDGVLLPDGKPDVNRRYCGEGEFDIEGYIAAVRNTGYDRAWGIELFADALQDQPLESLTTRAYETTASLFA